MKTIEEIVRAYLRGIITWEEAVEILSCLRTAAGGDEHEISSEKLLDIEIKKLIDFGQE